MLCTPSNVIIHCGIIMDVPSNAITHCCATMGHPGQHHESLGCHNESWNIKVVHTGVISTKSSEHRSDLHWRSNLWRSYEKQAIVRYKISHPLPIHPSTPTPYIESLFTHCILQLLPLAMSHPLVTHPSTPTPYNESPFTHHTLQHLPLIMSHPLLTTSFNSYSLQWVNFTYPPVPLLWKVYDALCGSLYNCLTIDEQHR